MKKLILLIFVLSTGFLKAQHYAQGVYVDTVLYTGSYSSVGGGCSSSENPDITLNSSLYNYVNGLQFQMVVDSVYFPGPPQSSPVHAGDVIVLDAADPVYFMPAPITFYFKLHLVGTPTTAGQTFPCNLEYVFCTCNCYHLYFQPTFNSPVCTVDLAQGLAGINKRSKLTLYPNPAVNKISVVGIDQPTSIKMYNGIGTLVLEQNTDHDTMIDVSALPEGIYTLSTGAETSKKIVISR